MIDLDLSIGIQTPQSLSARSPRKIKLINQVHQLKKENIQLNKETQSLQETSKAQLLSEVDFQKLCDLFLPPKVACFVKGQMDLLSRAAHFKEFALSLYFLGPKCYRQLQKTFCLPSTKVLQRFVATVNFAAGFNKDLFAFLKVKVDKMSLDDRICVLCINEMALKCNLFYNYGYDEIIDTEDDGIKKTNNPATSAVVLMARGINSGWKQPLGYMFSVNSCSVQHVKNCWPNSSRNCLTLV
jgi:hypothetical protein